MAEQCYLAVDLGAESGRVIAGRFDGGKIQLEELHRFANGPVNIGGTLRWNLVGLWKEILHGLGEAKSRFGDAVASVGVDTWGVDYCLLGKTGELLGLPYHYRDQRTRGMLDHVMTRVSRENIFAATGLQFMEINTLYQLAAHRQMHPDLHRLAARFLMIPDYFHWLLCGSQVVEFTNATTTQCLHATQRDWAWDLLRQLDLNTDMFPEIVAPGTQLGELRSDVGEATGLGALPVVTPATHDTGAAVAAVPTLSTGTPNWAYISSGTWSLMGVEIPDAILTPAALAHNVTNEGGVDGTYRMLKNIMGLWLVQECRRSFERAGRSLSYDELTNMARESKPFATTFNPDAPEFLSPDDMPDAIRAWCRNHGRPVPATEGELVRSCLESLALKYRMVMDWMEELTGTRIETIHIVGGGTQNELLNQFTADACNRPVITGPIEATALGNVLIQARSQGELGSLSEIRECVRASESIRQFEPQDQAMWEDQYAEFVPLV